MKHDPMHRAQQPEQLREGAQPRSRVSVSQAGRRAVLPHRLANPRGAEAGMALGLSFTRIIAHQMGAISSLGVGMPNAARRGTGRRSRP
jgi:hypothetical protein